MPDVLLTVDRKSCRLNEVIEFLIFRRPDPNRRSGVSSKYVICVTKMYHVYQTRYSTLKLKHVSDELFRCEGF